MIKVGEEVTAYRVTERPLEECTQEDRVLGTFVEFSAGGTQIVVETWSGSEAVCHLPLERAA